MCNVKDKMDNALIVGELVYIGVDASILQTPTHYSIRFSNFLDVKSR